MDALLKYCEDEAITATGESDALDFNVADPNYGRGGKTVFVLQCTEDFTNCTSIRFYLQDSADGITYAPVGIDKTILLADLVTGPPLIEIGLPARFRRHSKVSWTLAGTAPDAGQVTAMLTNGGGAGF